MGLSERTERTADSLHVAGFAPLPFPVERAGAERDGNLAKKGERAGDCEGKAHDGGEARTWPEHAGGAANIACVHEFCGHATCCAVGVRPGADRGERGMHRPERGNGTRAFSPAPPAPTQQETPRRLGAELHGQLRAQASAHHPIAAKIRQEQTAHAMSQVAWPPSVHSCRVAAWCWCRFTAGGAGGGSGGGAGGGGSFPSVSR